MPPSWLLQFLLLETRIPKKSLEKLHASHYSEISHGPAHPAVQRSDLASNLPSELANLSWSCPGKQVCVKVGSWADAEKGCWWGAQDQSPVRGLLLFTDSHCVLSAGAGVASKPHVLLQLWSGQMPEAANPGLFRPWTFWNILLKSTLNFLLQLFNNKMNSNVIFSQTLPIPAAY